MATTLLVTIDTEEEFDWSAPFSSNSRSVKHVADLPQLQELFEELGVRPTYVVDHPIATTDQSIDVLREIEKRNACEIGAHLHPWVNPPITEEITQANSFLCNLPLSLQQEKVEVLTEAIAVAFGRRPTSFKAGRFGFDFRLAPHLAELGYLVDSSVFPYYDWSHLGGPNYLRYGNRPFPLQSSQEAADREQRPLWEIPTSVGFNRRPFGLASRLRKLLTRRPYVWLHPIGVMWRMNILRRIPLTPEGTHVGDQLALLKQLAAEPDVVLNLMLHSPSIRPGCTPFVQSKAELEAFLTRLRKTIEFAIQRMGANCMTLSEFTNSNLLGRRYEPLRASKREPESYRTK